MGRKGERTAMGTSVYIVESVDSLHGNAYDVKIFV